MEKGGEEEVMGDGDERIGRKTLKGVVNKRFGG